MLRALASSRVANCGPMHKSCVSKQRETIIKYNSVVIVICLTGFQSLTVLLRNIEYEGLGSGYMRLVTSVLTYSSSAISGTCAIPSRDNNCLRRDVFERRYVYTY